MNLCVCYDKCSTCKKALKWMDSKGIKYETRPIKEKNPNTKELAEWIKKSGKEARKFFNTSGMLYRQMGLSAKIKNLSEEEVIEILSTDGMLVKRPILVTNSLVLVGFKENEWQDALNLGLFD